MESFPHSGITDLNKALRGSSIHFMVFGNERWFIKQSIKNFSFMSVFRSISHQFSCEISLRKSSRRFLLTYLFSKHTCSRSEFVHSIISITSSSLFVVFLYPQFSYLYIFVFYFSFHRLVFSHFTNFPGKSVVTAGVVNLYYCCLFFYLFLFWFYDRGYSSTFFRIHVNKLFFFLRCGCFCLQYLIKVELLQQPKPMTKCQVLNKNPLGWISTVE